MVTMPLGNNPLGMLSAWDKGLIMCFATRQLAEQLAVWEEVAAATLALDSAALLDAALCALLWRPARTARCQRAPRFENRSAAGLNKW